MPWSRRILVFLLLAGVVLLIGYAFLPRPVPVETAKAGRGPMRVTIEEEGKTRVKDRYVIAAPVAGYARRIELEVGDPVARGQAVAELEPMRSTVLDPRSRAEAKARVAAAEAASHAAQENAKVARAADEYASLKLARTRKLFESGLAPQDTLDQAEAEAKRAQASRLSAEHAVEVARFEIEAARTALGYSAAEAGGDREKKVTVRAPYAGRVLNIRHESEGVVNAGQTLIEIGDPGALEVEVDVLSSDAVRIRPGTKVLFERWGGSVPLEGKVRVVEPVGFTKTSALGVEEQRVLVIADIIQTPESRERLGDGYRLEASFVLWEGKDILQIPSGALFRYGDGFAVFVVEDGRSKQKPVQVGRRNGLAAQILSGLSEGETVITNPGDTIRDGARVRPR